MRDYRNFSYCPDYGYELYKNGTLDRRCEKVNGAACFAQVFNLFYGQNNVIFKGIYTLKCRKKFKKGSGNFCSMNREEVLKIVHFMRRSFEMGISLVETEDNFEFKFTIEGKPVKHKFILTFSRVFFEFPYNEIARDVLRMRALGTVDGICYTNRSFLEMYSVIFAVYQNYVGGGHSLFLYPQIDVRLKIAKERFQENLGRVQSVYPGDEKFYRQLKTSRKTASIDWDEDFESRVALYSENFQIIKDLKNGKKNNKNIRRRARKAIQ